MPAVLDADFLGEAARARRALAVGYRQGLLDLSRISGLFLRVLSMERLSKVLVLVERITLM